jgi:hypothetical protein
VNCGFESCQFKANWDLCHCNHLVFFWGDIFSSGEKVVSGVFSHQFFVIFKRLNKLSDFIFKFKQVVKDCFKFIYIHIFYSQNWLNCFMSYHHLVRLKGEKKH